MVNISKYTKKYNTRQNFDYICLTLDVNIECLLIAAFIYHLKLQTHHKKNYQLLIINSSFQDMSMPMFFHKYFRWNKKLFLTGKKSIFIEGV